MNKMETQNDLVIKDLIALHNKITIKSVGNLCEGVDLFVVFLLYSLFITLYLFPSVNMFLYNNDYTSWLRERWVIRGDLGNVYKGHLC